MSINDLQSTADELLRTAARIAPDLAKIETLKTVFSDATDKAGEGLRFASALGMVETRKGSNGGKKGEQLVVNAIKYQALDPSIRDQLAVLGVIVIEPVMGRVSRPAVSVKPVAA